MAQTTVQALKMLRKGGRELAKVKHTCFALQQSCVKLTFYKGGSAGACNSNRSMGVASCKPVNGQILCMHTHTKQGCAFHAVADTKSRVTKSRHGSRRTYISNVATLYHVFLNFASHMIQSGSDPDNFQIGSDPDDPDKM